MFFARRSEPPAIVQKDAAPAEIVHDPPAIRRASAPTQPVAVAAVEATPAGGTNQNRAVIAHRIEELETLAMNNDTASRDAIVAELQNPSKEIRHAALQAAIQFGDRSVVPRLQELAGQTEDTDE